MKNKNLTKAKAAKNDEFYTQATDIKQEVLGFYKEFFKGKRVYCPCDNYKKSEFFYFFVSAFTVLELEEIIATNYSETGEAYKVVVNKNNLHDLINEGTFLGQDHGDISLLEGNGDFGSDECRAIMAQCDVVVTNPPFSLFRDFVAQITELEKDFLIVGSMNAITYKDCFSLIKDNKMWLGVNSITSFVQPDGTIKKFGNICWFTNIKHHHRNEDIFLYKTYNKEEYPSYDNYNAIEVSKTVNIPCDFDGVMGVPISFLTKYSPEQFEIVGKANSGGWQGDIECLTIIDGVKKYHRILIKRKN